ncbi:hypothetical protein LBMAG27_02730 [Bacteroidota bacterium]|nr:hypothetical protein LBMAG27_02730 [Bacteroidota bacterium]
MIKKYFCLLLIFSSSTSFSQLSPSITSWIINTNGATGFDTIPTNVQLVQYSTTSVYITTDDIASWIAFGFNWPNNPWFPEAMGYTFRIRLIPTQNMGVPKSPPYGHIGLWKNGVSIYNPLDAKSYNNDTTWFQNAFYWEHLLGETMDPCLGHPNQSHEYHTHVSPVCLYDQTDSTHHSPLIGFAFDGYPIYGAYAFTNTNGTGAIKLMSSSFQLRNITDRTVLPDGTILQPNFYGPTLDSVPLGGYAQDYEFISGSGDLDIHNGRYCVTPEYPAGIYAYFVTIDANQIPVYPYVIGTSYYGTVIPNDGNMGPNSGHVVISESVTTYVDPNAFINETDDIISMEVYPNPTSANLNFILSSANLNEIAHGEIYNLRGEIIQSDEVQVNRIYTFNTQLLADGVYFLKIVGDMKTYLTKFIVVR